MILLMLGGPFMLQTGDWPAWAQLSFAGILVLGAIVAFVRNL
jgi:hypothetical protein